jgi:hypothetical protein
MYESDEHVGKGDLDGRPVTLSEERRQLEQKFGSIVEGFWWIDLKSEVLALERAA